MIIIPRCFGCRKQDATQYWYTTDDFTFLCADCARGVFCLRCGTFTGGTEDIFLFGPYACSECTYMDHEDEYEDDYECEE